uniref:Zinc transporter 2 n=1 Tax=Ascaris suum TaxID=6253 RepID=F1L6Z7_ASCSU
MTEPFNEGHDNEGLIGEESANGELSDAEVVRDISIADHCHSLLLLQNKDRRAERRLLAVAGLSTLFIVAEFTGGVLAHSLAIMTDAGHMLSDLLSFIISIVAIRIARSPANRRLSFGFHRAEVLGATVSIVIIWILTTVLIMLAIQRIVNNDLDVDSNTMIITASAGVVFNLIMGMVLKCSRHSHSHGIAHSQTTTSTNVNIRAAFIHVIGDLVQSIGVLVAAFIIKITGWRLADPICTFLFSIIVLITSVTVIRDIFFVLMEGTPSHIDYGELQSDLMRVDGVRTVHSLNVWSLNTDKTALAVHLAIDDQSKAIETMKAANRLIRFKHGIHLATVQVEPYESLMASCDFCRPLF